MILHERLHLLLDALVPLGDVDVQRVVAAGLAVGPFTPLLEGRDEADARLRDHMVNWIDTHTHTQGVKHADGEPLQSTPGSQMHCKYVSSDET